MCVYLPSDKLDKIQYLAHSMLQRCFVMVCQVIAFLGQAKYVQVGTLDFANGVMLFKVRC